MINYFKETNVCNCCGQKIDCKWLICPLCGFDISSFKKLSEKIHKYKSQLIRKRSEWNDIDTRILDAYESKDVSVVTLCQSLIEDLLKKPPKINYSTFIFNLYKNNEISPTENVFLGMLPILRNVITHGKPPKFDPIYFSILIKALNCSIDVAERRGNLIKVYDVDEYFVKPACYEKILNKIERDRIVLIIGIPTIGKTTIAKKVEKLFSGKYRILKEYPENPAMVKENTLIILDNCFGDAKLDFERLKKTIDLIEECYDIGCKFLLTSRKDVFIDAKNTEYFKESAFCEIIHKACLEIKVDDYKDVYDELVEKLLKRYRASDDKIKEALKRIDKITQNLKTPGDIDRFCRQWAVDKSRNIDEVIRKSKIIDEWIKSILETADLESKYWLTFVLIYNSSLIRKLRIPISHSGKKDKRQILLELFGEEVLRKTHPGISFEIIDIFEYISHQLKKLKCIVDIYQVLIEPESETSKLQLSMVKRLTDAYLKFKVPLSDSNDWITGGIFIEFAHETVEESVKDYILKHEPNLLRDVFKILKDLTIKFKSKATRLKLKSHNEFLSMEKLYSPNPEDLIIEFYCHYFDILKDFSSFVINILDEKFKRLRSKFPIDLLNNIDLISDDSHFGEISHIIIDTPLTNVIDNEIYKMLSDLVYDYERLLIRPNILKDETIKNYIFENLSDPLFNLIITDVIASNIVLIEIEQEYTLTNELLRSLLKYATNVAKKTLIVKLFKDFDKISDDLKKMALTELFKYPGYFIGEVFSISEDSAKLEIVNRILNLGDKRTLRSFITFLILDVLIKNHEIFKYSINGLMYFEDVFGDIIKKYNDKLSNVNKISTEEIYKQISNTWLNLVLYSEYLKAFGFPELENLEDKSEIYLSLKKLIEKYGLDYDVITKCALKNSKILFLLTMAEFIDDSEKKDILLFATLRSILDKKLIEIFSTLLHFPNEFILNDLVKTHKKNLINYILDLYKRAIQIFIVNLYFLKFRIDAQCHHYNIEFNKILNPDIIKIYEKCRKLYDYDDELPERVISEISMLVGWKPEEVKAIFNILSSIEESIAEDITSIPIPAVHSIIEEFIKDIIRNETDENVLKTARLVVDHIQSLRTTCGLEFLGPIIKIDLYKLINFIKSLKSLNI